MKRFSLLSKVSIALLLVISVAGCHLNHPVTGPIDIKRAMPRWKYIGITKDPLPSECPKVKGWKERFLFAPEKPAEEESESKSYTKVSPLAPELPKELARFCVYEAKGWFRKPPSSPDLESVAPDAVALAPAGLETLVQPRLSVQFFEQVGRPVGRSLLLPIDHDSPKVRLAFLDSYPTSQEFPFSIPERCVSGHGDFLRHLGEALTCERDDCMTKITTRLALPIRKFDRHHELWTELDPRCGGYIGSFGNLAEAINGEVSDWQAENLSIKDPKMKSRLILNLSLGWNGAQFGGLEGSVHGMAPEPRSVYTALANAARLGALIIAAVGNDRSGPDAPTGPMLPAGWETAPPVPEEGAEPLPVPFLYAVGGLRSDDQALANLQRNHSMPGLAAYADHAALGPFIVLPSWPTSTYTGTSVAAAVVSSIAAVVWHEQHGLSAQEVIDLIRRSGRDLVRFDDEHRVPGTPPVKRVSLCKALAEARRLATPSAVSVACPDPGPPDPEVPASSLMLSDLLDGASPSDPPLGWNPVLVVPRGCAPGTYLAPADGRIPESAENLCPSDVLVDVKSESWLHPAPANEPCPSCTDPPHRPMAMIREGAEGYRSLHIEINDDWPEWIIGGGTLESATLEIKGTDGSLTRYFIRGHPRLLNFPAPAGGFDNRDQVTLNWRVCIRHGCYSIRTPVFIAD